MDLLSDSPELDLYDGAWPIHSFQPSFPPPRVVLDFRAAGRGAGGARPNAVANGTLASGWLSGVVAGFDCRIDPCAVVEDSVLFDGAHVCGGAEVRRAILDKAVQVRPGARVGFDPEDDRRRGFLVSEDGVACVPKGSVVD
jgi:glucose-1-phosphate adenylyltransferase